MKNIKTLLLIIAATLLFTACEKEETIENYDSISGIFTAGENLSAADLNTISLMLAKVEDGIAPAIVTTETDEIEILETIKLNADGSFNFNALENGNYILALSEDFVFSDNSFSVLTVDGTTKNTIDKSIDRVASDNSPKEYEWKIKNKTNYSITQISFFYENELYKTIDVSKINNNKFEITLDRKKEVTLKLECKNGEQLILSNPVEFFGLDAACNIFTQTDHGDLTVYAYWWFGQRRIKLFDYCYSCGF